MRLACDLSFETELERGLSCGLMTCGPMDTMVGEPTELLSSVGLSSAYDGSSKLSSYKKMNVMSGGFFSYDLA